MKLDTEFYQLPMLFDGDRLAREVQQMEEADWRPHPQGYPGNHAAILISSDGLDNDALDGEMRPTPRLAKLPYLHQVMAAFHTPVGRSRLMRIQGQGRVPRHSDIAHY